MTAMQPIHHPAPDARLAVELGVMDAMVDIHRATDADSMRAAFRAARTAMAPALEALDRECRPCAGTGFEAEPRVNGGQDSVESTCEKCGGSGRVQP